MPVTRSGETGRIRDDAARYAFRLAVSLVLIVLVTGAFLAWYWPRGDEVWNPEVGHCYRVTRGIGRAVAYREVACP